MPDVHLMVPSLAARIKEVRARMAAACDRVGRPYDEVSLVAVSKTRTAEEVLGAMLAGLEEFGENRPEEGEGKISAVARLAEEHGVVAPRWHMVGHIQSRKAKLVIGRYELIHSLDSSRLAFRLNRLAAEAGSTASALLEINVSGEASKYGFPGPEDNGSPHPEFLRDLERILELSHLRVMGLMTMAPLSPDPEDSRPHFRRLYRMADWLRDHYPGVTWKHLSMGMTDDFEVAIEEGATIVRVGRAIFGEREP